MNSQYIPFVYIIQEILSGKLYIGSKYGKNSNPTQLLKTYMTSSAIVKELIKQNGPNSFNIVFIKEFDNATDAVKYESELIIEKNAVKDDLYFNLSNQKTKFHVSNHKWITDGKTECYYPVGVDLPNGFRYGRLKQTRIQPQKGLKFKKLNKDGIVKQVNISDISTFLDDGWIIGDTNASSTNKQWITNGIISDYVTISNDIPNGWVKGRIRDKNSITELTRYKAKAVKSRPIETPHFCAFNARVAYELYMEYYNTNMANSYVAFIQNRQITKIFITKRPDICSLFNITELDIQKSFYDVIHIKQLNIKWPTSN